MCKRLILAVLFFSVLALMSAPVWAQGCSMCRTALEQSVEGQAIAGSFNYGILFLMGIPYAMFGTAGIAIFRAYRKQVKKKGNA